MAAMATVPWSTVSSWFLFFLFFNAYFCFSYDSKYLDCTDNGHGDHQQHQHHQQSASPQVVAWRVRWHRDNSAGDSQQRLEMQHVSSCWYVFCFFVLFITLIFILGSLKALKRGWQHQHQHQGLKTRHVSSRL